jgi:hypothetical protein
MVFADEQCGFFAMDSKKGEKMKAVYPEIFAQNPQFKMKMNCIQNLDGFLKSFIDIIACL